MIARPLRAAILLLVATLVASCQIAPKQQKLAVSLGGTSSLQLQTQWFEEPVQQLQQITWRHPEHPVQTMLVSSVLKATGIVLVGLSPLGQELWRVELVPGRPPTIRGIEPFSQPQLAKAMVADMQLHLWPLTHLQNRLEYARVQDNGQQRTVTNLHGNLLWRASEGENSIRIENISGGYQLDIKLLQREQLKLTEQER